jgi:ubiquinone/menaquinone biosynthesis C-methylase UbiE
MVGGEPGDDILEVGCGAGNVLEAVPAGRLTGFDLSMTMMRKARRRLRSRTSRLALANAEAIPLPDNSYDKLLCSDVLEHCRNPAIVIDEICRVAKPGAAVVLSVPNEGLIRRFKQFACCSWLSRVVLRGGYSPPRRMEWHLHDFDLALLREITAHKLTLVELQAIPLNIIPLYYVAKYRA